eukprot:symbB.v1.2.001636.t1/scaffold90.1/size339071/5
MSCHALLRLAQEILEVDPRASQKPIWICLTSIGADSGFEAIPVRITPPACVSATTVLGMSSMFFKVVDEPQELVRYNVQRGIFLTIAQLSDILGARGIPKPRKPHGSGKGGAVRKDDLALCLIRSLFPDALEEDVTRMLAAIMGKKKLKNPETLLQLVSKLDSSETQHFDKMKKDAVQELEVLHHRRVQKAKKAMENPDLEAGAPKERPGGPIHPGKGAGVMIFQCNALRRSHGTPEQTIRCFYGTAGRDEATTPTERELGECAASKVGVHGPPSSTEGTREQVPQGRNGCDEGSDGDTCRGSRVGPTGKTLRGGLGAGTCECRSAGEGFGRSTCAAETFAGTSEPRSSHRATTTGGNDAVAHRAATIGRGAQPGTHELGESGHTAGKDE